MKIDVLINSCARPDVMEVSLQTFLKNVKTNNHIFRYVILADYVESSDRRSLGLKWIENNKHMFDEVVIQTIKLGPTFFFGPVVKTCTSDYFFHLEG